MPGSAACGFGVHRSSLFNVLFDAVQASGIAIETDSEIAATALTGEGRTLTFADGRRSAAYDLVVDALGTRSPLAPPCGRWLEFGALWATLEWPEAGPFDTRLLEQRYRLAGEMVGILPTGRRAGVEEFSIFWSLRTDYHDAWQAAGMDSWKRQVEALWSDAKRSCHRSPTPSS